MLKGLDQNGMWQRTDRVRVPVCTTKTPSADRTALTHSVSLTKHGKPDDSRQDAGTDLARGKDESAGRGCRRKQMPLCNGVDRMFVIRSERMLTSGGFEMTRRQ